VTEIIRSARLDLVPLTRDFLEATLAGERSRLEVQLSAAVPEDWPPPGGLLQLRLDQLRADPDLQPWLLRALVLRAERRMIGHAGFHGAPGGAHLEPFAPGGAELGYTVFARDRGRGYATEAAVALMEWAQRAHGVSGFVLSIRADNAPSLRIAKRLGFVRVGFHLDPEDGPEDIFSRTLER
jgi:RimJ/RimL family protein N-acetyltransferase